MAIVSGPAFGSLMVATGQCQATVTCHPRSKRDDLVAVGDRCPNRASASDPRLCWVHSKAFNNPARAYPLPLHKSVTE
jgi:hypothetical protein